METQGNSEDKNPGIRAESNAGVKLRGSASAEDVEVGAWNWPIHKSMTLLYDESKFDGPMVSIKFHMTPALPDAVKI